MYSCCRRVTRKPRERLVDNGKRERVVRMDSRAGWMAGGWPGRGTLGKEDGRRASNSVGVRERVGRRGDDGEDEARQALRDVGRLLGADLRVLRLAVGDEGNVVVARVALLRGEAEGRGVTGARGVRLEREGRELLDRSRQRGSLAAGVGEDDAVDGRGDA